MSKVEILRELPKLDVLELREIHERILQLEEEELLAGRTQPTAEEKALLDAELKEYSRNSAAGSSWEKSNPA